MSSVYKVVSYKIKSHKKLKACVIKVNIVCVKLLRRQLVTDTYKTQLGQK